MKVLLNCALALCLACPALAQNCQADFTFGETDITIDFTDQSTSQGSDPIVNWSWDFDDGATSNEQNPTHTFPDPDVYQVCLTITTASGCTDTYCVEIETCVLQLSLSVGDCDANDEIPITINVSDPYDAAKEINISVDGNLLPGSPFDIDDDAPVTINTTVPGDGLTHTVTVQSEDVGTCSATESFQVPDCTSDCFLSSMSVNIAGGTTYNVDVGDNFFAPQNTTIIIGDVVHFQWVGDGHSTTSDAATGPDSWNSGVIGFGATYDVNITNPGVHGYYCIPHGDPGGSGMAGTIVANCPPSGQFAVIVSFTTTVANPAGYQILVDGVTQPGSPFSYNGTGLQSQSIQIAGDGQSHLIEVQDVADPTCVVSRDFLAPDCGAAPTCSLTLSAQQNGGCNASNQVPVDVSVQAINPGAAGFDVFVDGTLDPNSPFAYVPSGTTVVTVNVAGDGQSHTIEAIDVADPSCSGTTTVTTQNCSVPCSITNLTATAGSNTTHTVFVEDFVFNPASITITAGDIVEWEWTGAVGHTTTSDATSGPDSWDSGLLGTGASYQSPQLSAGVHGYYCIPHGGPGGQGMAGTITVQADCTNGLVQVTVTFDEQGGGFNGFEVLVDGTSQGTYPYDASGSNSVAVQVAGDGQPHTITVQDVDSPNCSASTTVTTPDCNAPTCSLSLSAQESGGCSNGEAPVEVTVTDAGGGASGFELFVDGTLEGAYPYSGNGTTTVTVSVAGDGQAHTITATDIGAPDCTAGTAITTTDCSIPCSITGLTAGTGSSAVHTVFVEDFVFSPASITITAGDIVEWEWTGAVAHTATSDATSGPDSWDSGLLGTGASYQSPQLSAGVHGYYCVPHGGPGGQGMAGTITVQADCANGMVQATVAFDAQGGGPAGYEVLVDGASQGSFPYDASGSNSATVAVPGDGQPHTITVQDVDSPNCSASTTVTTPDCNAPTCSLSISAQESGGCSNGAVPVEVTVTDAGGGASGFELFVDGTLEGAYPYSGNGTTAVTVNVAGDGQAHTITATDIDAPNCTAGTAITTTDCSIPCQLTDLTISTATAPTLHLVEVRDFDFSPKDVTAAPGDTVRFIWAGVIPHTTTSDAATGASSWDSGLLDQGEVYDVILDEIGIHPYYCIPHGAPGGIGMAGTIEVVPACDEMGNTAINITFASQGTGTAYQVFIDGEQHPQSPFAYAQGGNNTLLLEIEGDGGQHELQIEDSSQSSCAILASYQAPLCQVDMPCELTLSATEAGVCDESNNVPIDLTILHSGQTGSHFNVFVNGNLYTGSPFNYASGGDSTLLAISVAGNGQDRVIVVADADSTACSDSVVVSTPICDVTCEILDLEVLPGGNAKHIVEVADYEFVPEHLNITVGDTVQFVWTGVVPHTTTSDATSGSDYWNSGLLGQGGVFELVITEAGQHPYYCIPHGGPGGIGMAGRITAQPSCEDGEALVAVQFSATNGSSAGYRVFLDGVAIAGPIPYNEPAGFNSTTVMVPGDSLQHILTVQDLETAFCAASFTFTSPLCEQFCQIQNLQAATGSDVVHEVKVEDFEFTPQTLAVRTNETVRFVWTGTVPHTVTSDASVGPDHWDSGLLGQGAVYELSITEAGQHPYYCIPHGGPGGIGMAGTIAAVADCEEGAVQVALSFNVTNGSSNGYKVFVDGDLLPDSPYPYDAPTGENQLYITLPGDGQQHFITVQDTEVGFCAATTSLTVPDCNAACSMLLDSVLLSPRQVHVVEVRDFDFAPRDVSVTVGDTVRFTWTGAVPHTVTSDASDGPATWDSGLLDQGAVYDWVATTTGLHPYYCTPHGGPGGIGMAGTIEAFADCEDGMQAIAIGFTVEHPGDSGYEVVVDGVATANSPYDYDSTAFQLAFLELPADGMAHDILIADLEDPDCQLQTVVETVNCSEACAGFASGFTYEVDSENAFRLHFTDSTSGQPNQWLWGFGDGTTSNEQNPSHTYSGSGVYSVCLLVQDTLQSCSALLCEEITVATTQGKDINRVSQAITLYPNPSGRDRSYWTMTGIQASDNGEALDVVIYDSRGRMVRQQHLAGQAEMRLTVPYALAAGLYIVELRSAKHVYRGRILVQ